MQVCPNNTRLRGMGCLGNYQPFNTLSPLCIKCTLQMPDPSIEGNTYLNYNSVNGTVSTGGCAIENCAALITNYYWSIPCAGPIANSITKHIFFKFFIFFYFF